jgi:hypothetical protein
VDTYFALGLEFDEGKRLKSDEEMINSAPRIFSSFYNLPCPARPLEELNLIAGYFPLMVRFYPKTLLLLSLESHESVSDLFIRWLHWLRRQLNRKELSLSPQDCYLHFREFVSDTLMKAEKPAREHLDDILMYENLALEVGKFTQKKGGFQIDHHRIHEFRPSKSEEILIKEFDFEIPVIILDLKAGNFRERYPRQKTFLAFRQEDDLLDVSEVNPFAKDFLDLCNGKSTVQAISDDLYNHYGKDMTPEDFLANCVEAVEVLGTKGFIRSG